MCRYAVKPYKTSYVCVPCRHVAQSHYDKVTTMRCPRCRADLVHVGRDFQAPRKGNKSGWDAVATVLAAGKTYDSCGCNGPGYRPRTMAQVRQDATERPWPRPNRKT
jgi:DNA-directed RNA polymerase subunit RPC12/RpoP